MEKREKATATLIHVVLIIAAFIMVVPFLWMVLTAFKTVTESTSINPFVIFPPAGNPTTLLMSGTATISWCFTKTRCS